MAIFQGDFGPAKTLLEESLAFYRGLDDREGVASCLVNLGFVALLGQRDDLPVPALLEEAMELKPKLKERRTITHLLILAGMVAGGRGDLDKAIELHEESLSLLRRMHDMQTLGGCLANLGFLELGRNNHARASALFREDLNLARESDDKVVMQFALLGLGVVASILGQLAHAARLWGASEAVRQAFGIHLSPLAASLADYENRLAATRASLGDATFAGAWDEGETMPRDEAIGYALAGEEPSPEPEKASVDAREEVLSRREMEVALLIAQGLTNRRIAEELSISERTVATHVGKIFKKLGLRSRDEVAPVLERRQHATE